VLFTLALLALFEGAPPAPETEDPPTVDPVRVLRPGEPPVCPEPRSPELVAPPGLEPLPPDPWAGSELVDEDPEPTRADGVVVLEHAATVTATATTRENRISVGAAAALIRTIARPLS
jgi:hypothetical protein